MSNVVVLESSYTPRPHSLAFHSRSQRFSVMVWHRRAGKTVACINDLIDKAIQCPLDFPKYAYIAPFYSQAKSIAWVYLKHYASPLIEKVMESELSVVLKNGATIRLYGADNPDSLRGNYFDGVILDEYGDMTPRLFGEVIAPTLADRKGWCVFIGTPKGMNHFFDLWEEAAVNDRWFTSMLKASTSGIIDDEELSMLRDMPGSDDQTYEQEFECSFRAAIRGSYYGKILGELEDRGHMGIFPHDRDLPVLTAWDIGYSDDTSVWFYQTNGKEFKIIDFFTVSGYSVDDVLAHLRGKEYAYGTMYLPHDAKNKSFQTGKSTRELMIAAGCSTQLVPSMSIQDGIQAARKTLPRVFFNTCNPDVKLGVNALKMYQREWDDKRKIFKEAPKHDWSSNPADAFRMFALAMNPSAVKKGAVSIGQAPPNPADSRHMNLTNLFSDRESRLNDTYKRI